MTTEWRLLRRQRLSRRSRAGAGGKDAKCRGAASSRTSVTKRMRRSIAALILALAFSAAAAALPYLSAAGLASENVGVGIGIGSGGSGSGSGSGADKNDPAPPKSIQPSRVTPIRVAYQGEPGAYSHKSVRELLGPDVIAVGLPNFEQCYRAVVAREVDYCLLPVENSLGGSIHENYDLMLRYDLTIVAEHEFRVKHCLLAAPGVTRDDVKYAISHPQALAQCDNYLRGLGITPIPTYDTAGSAKMIMEDKGLPEGCTPSNTAAVASELAGKTYGLNCLDAGIEDDTSNFTRFLLLGRQGVVQYLNKKIQSKTSIVFTLPNAAGALYKALACFALRDIDCSKIESRPTSASLLSFLKFRSQAMGRKRRTQAQVPRFRYCFYLDFLASELDESAQYALSHLREQADFCRILGSYPAKSRLVGPVADVVERLKHARLDGSSAADDAAIGAAAATDETSAEGMAREVDERRLCIGIVGYGTFGTFLGRKFAQLGHSVRCVDTIDRSREAEKAGIEYYQPFDMSNFLRGVDVVVVSVPLVDFEDAITGMPSDGLSGKLVVEVCPLSAHPKEVLMRHLPPDADIICSHPMFGPTGSRADVPDLSDAFSLSASSSSSPSPSPSADESPLDIYTPESWDGQPFVYDRVRVADMKRADAFLRIFERSRCQMVEMTAEQHDDCTADAEFVTHLTGRLLGRDLLPPTPVASKEYAALSDVADLTGGDTFDQFYGMFKYNDRAKYHLNKMRENLARIERQLAAKEAYLAASAELRNSDRKKLVAECRSLLEDAIRSGRFGLGREEEEEEGKKEEEEKDSKVGPVPSGSLRPSSPDASTEVKGGKQASKR